MPGSNKKTETEEVSQDSEPKLYAVNTALSSIFKIKIGQRMARLSKEQGRALSVKGWNAKTLWEDKIPSKSKTIHDLNSVAAILIFGGDVVVVEKDYINFSLDERELIWHKLQMGGYWTDKDDNEFCVSLNIPLHQTEPELILCGIE